MDPTCLLTTVQAAVGGAKVRGKFSWCTSGPLILISHHLNVTASLSIVADHLHPFVTTVYHLITTANYSDVSVSVHIKWTTKEVKMISLSQRTRETNVI